jgi:hypothetical protein
MRPRGVALSSEMSKNTKGLACVGKERGAHNAQFSLLVLKDCCCCVLWYMPQILRL